MKKDISLIANSGIQLYSTDLEIELSDNFKMYFHEWFDAEDDQLKLELVHHYAEEDVWVKKLDLLKLGALQKKDEMNGDKLIKAGTVKEPWSAVNKCEDFLTGKFREVIPNINSDSDETDCFPISLNRLKWDKFENHWLPMPFFALGKNNQSKFGPVNWCRFKLVPGEQKDQVRKYTLLIAFDTRTRFESQGFEAEDLVETPTFSNYDRSKQFSLCNSEFSLIDFCSKSMNCEWVDEYILELFHGEKSLDGMRIKKPKMSYLAQYVFLLRYIQQLKTVPEVTLFSNRNVAYGDVDLVVDMGNSRTCAVLFDNHDFTQVENLELQNFTNPLVNGELNKSREPFDMRLAFHEASFGGHFIKNSPQFVYPSAVRLGIEANELIHNTASLNIGLDKITTFSSPKRFLWDSKPQKKEWEFISFDKERSKNIWIKGISEQVNADGTLNTDGSGGFVSNYSRRSLMTFAFLEIFSQARMQINGYAFRQRWGDEKKPRRLDRILITCPTAMSKVEQIALRKCAEDAAIMLERFYNETHLDDLDEKAARKNVQIIPSSASVSKNSEDKSWIYDEATCTQFVYLYAEINKRYNNNCKEFFEFYGGKSGSGETSKHLTIGSVDIGAGTTDLMIADYTYGDTGQCLLKPEPLFWESFYLAGDDMLKDLVRKLIIEGEFGAMELWLKKLKKAEASKLINDFFGENTARQSITARQIRSEFNLQVSVPVVVKYLELLAEDKQNSRVLTFNDIFSHNMPTERVQDYFQNHFGFSLKDIAWQYDRKIIAPIVESVFDSLVGKISAILAHYKCDIVLLSGRPTGLKPISDLFLKYFAVSPNRIVALNKYRVGRWYPFQDGNGYFKDSKSVVAVGAMIGHYSSTAGSLNGFALDLSELGKKMVPTSDYFALKETEEAFITPALNSNKVSVPQLPWRIWTRQLDTKLYPTRPFYLLDFNLEKIEEKIKNKKGLFDEQKQEIQTAFQAEFEKLKKQEPFKFTIIRESYRDDKEIIKIDSVESREGEDITPAYFTLQLQSMSEDSEYWMDTGVFQNLKIVTLK